MRFSLRMLLGVMFLASIFFTLAVIANFRLTFGHLLHVRCEKGRLTFCDALENGITIDNWGDLSTFTPPVTSDLGFSTSGFGFRYVTFAGTDTVWSVHLPLLVFLVMLTVVVGLSFQTLRRIRRSFAQHAEPLTAADPGL